MTMTCNGTAAPDATPNVATATRLMTVKIPREDGRAVPTLVSLCDDHAQRRLNQDFGDSSLFRVLPAVTEDEHLTCCDCVHSAGFAYAVHLSYFKPDGKYYSSGSFLTKAKSMGNIFDEVHVMLNAGTNPGLSDGAVRRNNFRVHVHVTGHPSGYPALIRP